MIPEADPPIYTDMLAARIAQLDEASQHLFETEVSRRVWRTRRSETAETRASLVAFGFALEGQLTAAIDDMPDSWDTLSGASIVNDSVITRVRGIYEAVSKDSLEKSKSRWLTDRLRVSRLVKIGGTVLPGVGAAIAYVGTNDIIGHTPELSLFSASGLGIAAVLAAKKGAANYSRNTARRVFGEHYRRYVQPVAADTAKEVNKQVGIKAPLKVKADKTRAKELDNRMRVLRTELESTAFQQLALPPSLHTPEAFAARYAKVTALSIATNWGLGMIDLYDGEEQHIIDK